MKTSFPMNSRTVGVQNNNNNENLFFLFIKTPTYLQQKLVLCIKFAQFDLAQKYNDLLWDGLNGMIPN